MSDEAQPKSDTRVSREILRYLVEHPDAKDTIEGILKWWLPDGHRWGSVDVQKALDLLTSKGWLTKRETIPSKEIYGINRNRLADIERFLLQSGSIS